MTGSALDPAVAARLKRDAQGLVAAVVQQHDTGEVLMVGWMDDEALHRTLTTGRVTFWSRSRGEYWRKGDTSGHVQHVRAVALDCDGDALLVASTRSAPPATPATAPASTPAALLGALSVPPAGPSAPSTMARMPATRRRTMAGPRRRSARWPATAGSSRSSGGCSPTPRPRSASTASSPHGRPGTFLLESAEHGGVWSRYSIVGARSPPR